MDNDKDLDELIDKIKNTKLIDEEDLKNMDFYQLAYYYQTLNTIDSIDKEDK